MRAQPVFLGLNRGRQFRFTGQTLTGRQAQELGLVNEVLSRQDLLPRAWALAEQLAPRPPLVLRYSRAFLTQHLKRLMHDLLGHGLALEGWEWCRRLNATARGANERGGVRRRRQW